MSRYNLTWLVTQSVPELNRLQTVVALYALPDGDRDEEQVQLWLDIFKNRLQLFGNGEAREFFDRRPDMDAALARAHQVATQVQALLPRLGAAGTPRGQKLVVQMVETFREHMAPAFVERLDAWELAERAQMPLPPVMIYGDDVSHVLTEEGIANLLLCRTPEEREQAIRGVAGYTAVGLGRDRAMVENLRDRGVIRRPDDLGISVRDASRDLLAARSVKDLVRWSGGLYDPPKRFRNW